jgi:sigma-E factor negative regulatory protein RseC
MQAPEVTGRVTALVEGAETLEADVAVATSAACARCRAGRGCGAGLPGVSSAERTLRVAVPDGISLVVGDPVTLCISGPSLLAAAGIAYGLPLAGLLSGALLGQALVPGDLGAPLAALAGLVAGAWIARRRAARFCWQHEEQGLLTLEAGSRR